MNKLFLILVLSFSLYAVDPATNITVHCPTTSDGILLVTWNGTVPVFVRDEENPTGGNQPHNFPAPGFTFEKNQRGPVLNSTTFTITSGNWLVYLFVNDPYWQSVGVPISCIVPTIVTPPPPPPPPTTTELTCSGLGFIIKSIEGTRQFVCELDFTIIQMRTK